MSSKIIPLKGRADSRNPAEFWPQRLFPLELRHRADAARATSRRKVRARMANRNLPGFTETRLRGWAYRTRTRKCRFFVISGELLGFTEHFATQDFSRTPTKDPCKSPSVK